MLPSRRVSRGGGAVNARLASLLCCRSCVPARCMVSACCHRAPLACPTGVAILLYQLLAFPRWSDELRHAPRFARSVLCLLAVVTLENFCTWATSASDARKHAYTPLQDNAEIALLWLFQVGRAQAGQAGVCGAGHVLYAGWRLPPCLPTFSSRAVRPAPRHARRARSATLPRGGWRWAGESTCTSCCTPSSPSACRLPGTRCVTQRGMWARRGAGGLRKVGAAGPLGAAGPGLPCPVPSTWPHCLAVQIPYSGFGIATRFMETVAWTHLIRCVWPACPPACQPEAGAAVAPPASSSQLPSHRPCAPPSATCPWPPPCSCALSTLAFMTTVLPNPKRFCYARNFPPVPSGGRPAAQGAAQPPRCCCRCWCGLARPRTPAPAATHAAAQCGPCPLRAVPCPGPALPRRLVAVCAHRLQRQARQRVQRPGGFGARRGVCGGTAGTGHILPAARLARRPGAAGLVGCGQAVRAGGVASAGAAGGRGACRRCWAGARRRALLVAAPLLPLCLPSCPPAPACLRACLVTTNVPSPAHCFRHSAAPPPPLPSAHLQETVDKTHYSVDMLLAVVLTALVWHWREGAYPPSATWPPRPPGAPADPLPLRLVALVAAVLAVVFAGVAGT